MKDWGFLDMPWKGVATLTHSHAPHGIYEVIELVNIGLPAIELMRYFKCKYTSHWIYEVF